MVSFSGMAIDHCIVQTGKNNTDPSFSSSFREKYSRYDVEVDPEQDDKSTEIKIGSCHRPHMRNFHSAWFAFFSAFVVWYAASPLLPEIKKSLSLTKEEIWTSTIAGVGMTAAVRIVLGPICDRYGPKIPMAIILWLAAIPTACLGFVKSAMGLIILRAFIGVAGGSFVMCMMWSTINFTKEVVGSANGIAGGWGNLGAGATQMLVGRILFPMFKAFFDGDAEKAWRSVCIVPAFLAFCSGLWILRYSDDTPKGDYGELKMHGLKTVEPASTLIYSASRNRNTWILFVQYATCFGVEITMNNATALYFTEEFGQSTESAAALVSIFGWMNLFARGLGGVISDMANAKMGMRGRILANTVLLVGEGVMVLVFSRSNTLGGAICALVVFSLFVSAAEGSCFGIVPYIDYPRMGTITGIVGAGGSVGALGFSMAFRQLDYGAAFDMMGLTVLASSLLSFFVNIRGESRLMRCNTFHR
jgi:MFS transporter, NNP family, nitrate/nitrite transporter